MTDPKTMIDRYTSAVTARDIDALLALYLPDARVFDMMIPWQHTSMESYRELLNLWFEQASTTPTMSDVRVDEHGDVALITAQLDFADQDNALAPQRLSWLLLREDNDWKILHEHNSVPLDEHASAPARR